MKDLDWPAKPLRQHVSRALSPARERRRLYSKTDPGNSFGREKRFSSQASRKWKHNAATHHPIITSFEPGERWFYDYRSGEFFAGPALPVPHSHPLDQPVPGPAGRVPANWQTLLHE
jgi:hypothetical protein